MKVPEQQDKVEIAPTENVQNNDEYSAPKEEKTKMEEVEAVDIFEPVVEESQQVGDNQKQDDADNKALIDNRLPTFELPPQVVAVPRSSAPADIRAKKEEKKEEPFAAAPEEEKKEESESSSSSDSDFDMLEAIEKS